MQMLVFAAFDELPVLHGDGDLVPIAADLAVQHQALAAREHALQIVPPREQRRRRVAAVVAEEQGERRPPASRRWGTHAGNHARARDRLADLQRAERREARAVLVPDGNEEQRIAHGRESLSGQ
jgi:hypothetical protein